MFGKKKEWEGAWEEPGVIGTRIEIEKNRISVLWRNEPVLETTFETEKKDDCVELILAHKGMRYQRDVKDYAQVTSLRLVGGKLEFTEFFPITGESRTLLSKTENSRFGNYEIDDRILKELSGNWKSTDGYWSLTFRGDLLTFNDRKTKVHALKSRNSYGDGRYLIVDQDPSKYEMEGFSRFTYEGGRLTTRMLICDAPSPEIVFVKEA